MITYKLVRRWTSILLIVLASVSSVEWNWPTAGQLGPRSTEASKMDRATPGTSGAVPNASTEIQASTWQCGPSGGPAWSMRRPGPPPRRWPGFLGPATSNHRAKSFVTTETHNRTYPFDVFAISGYAVRL